jgi:hypothetical protein
MHIEDLIISLVYSKTPLNRWDQTLVSSFYDQISRGSSFTEKQSVLAIKTINRYSTALSAAMKTDLTPFLLNPTFRNPLRQVSHLKKLNVTDHPVYGKAVRAIFPYSENLIKRIRDIKDESPAIWDKEEKCWFFSLREAGIQFLMELAEEENFEVDEYFHNLSQQVKKITENFEQYVPMLVIEDKIPQFKNCRPELPKLQTVDILESIFEARKRGIFTWDDTISNFLDSDEVDPITREFLKSPTGSKFQIDSENHEISVIKDIIKFMGPTLVIIPGGNELATLTASYEFFKSMDIKNTDMSVMFRLPSETHEIFNNFVKFNELNSPIRNETKIIFVSSKLPKPVLNSKIKFHSILNLGYNNVHYSLRDYVGNHENVMFYSKIKDQRNVNFGYV